MAQLLSEAALAAAFELALFAAVLFALFGLDDLALDVLAAFGPKDKPINAVATTKAQASTAQDQRLAVFIPAWREGDVIGAMLDHLTRAWAHAPIAVYVGAYANDPGTIFAAADVAMRDRRVRLVLNHQHGPTTKGACLNRLWEALHADIAAGKVQATAILLHDAEDMVDPAALDVLSAALADADYAQLQVIPVTAATASMIGWHYCDEFAEAHQRDMPVRSALGAPMPTAGVGCAFAIAALNRLSGGHPPFCAGSLTEDYELGIRLSAMGARGRFVAVRDAGGRRIATRSMFPDTLVTAVRQKARWMRGIALDGWEQLGWPGGTQTPGAPRSNAFPAARRMLALWMLWRDRRTLLAAMATFAGYAALLLLVVATPFAGRDVLNGHDAMMPLARFLFAFNLVMLLWRVALRGWFTGRIYGWRQGLLAPLRLPISNIIHVMTAWRAVAAHIAGRRGSPLLWDKTEHHFPPAHTPQPSLAKARRP